MDKGGKESLEIRRETKGEKGRGINDNVFKEVKEKGKRFLELTRWEEERREFFGDRGRGEAGNIDYEELEKRYKEMQVIDR